MIVSSILNFMRTLVIQEILIRNFGTYAFSKLNLREYQEQRLFLRFNPKERCPSGLRSTPGKCVYAKSVPRVRIPVSPQIIIALKLVKTRY